MYLNLIDNDCHWTICVDCFLVGGANTGQRGPSPALCAAHLTRRYLVGVAVDTTVNDDGTLGTIPMRPGPLASNSGLLLMAIALDAALAVGAATVLLPS